MAITDERREEWKRQVDFLLEEDGLTEWEDEFVDSVSIWLSDGKDLTRPQSTTLRRIYNKVVF